MNTPVYRSEVDVPLEIPFLNNITPYKINLVFTNQSIKRKSKIKYSDSLIPTP
jgi:hypothetical protein